MVVKIPPQLREFRHQIGACLLAHNRRARLVLQVVGPTVHGARTRRMEAIAGVGPAVTMHREHGATYVVDLGKVFFTPRLSQERRRVALQVKPGENVLNMFAGAGCFSILIAHTVSATVYSVDSNPAAIECMRQGLARNNLAGRVIPLLGDARQICKEMSAMDRVILPLPLQADDFLEDAIRVLGDRGVIHHYREVRARRSDCLPISSLELGRILEGLGGWGECQVTSSRIVRSVGRRRWHVVHDVVCARPRQHC